MTVRLSVVFKQGRFFTFVTMVVSGRPILYLLLAVYLVTQCYGDQSKLRVAFCNPGSVPFVTMTNGKLVGFEVDLWNRVYSDMSNAVQQSKIVPNPIISPEVEALVGTSPPTIKLMSVTDILAALGAQTIDIGVCGLIMSPVRLESFDFVYPFHTPSGYISVAAKPAQQPTFVDVIMGLTNCMNPKAQLILLLLLLFVFVFGHLVGLENIISQGYVNVRDNYFEATQDGMWYAIVIMSTVGYGDVFSKGLLGRVFTVAWIFWSISLMAMLLAVITSYFLNWQMIPDSFAFHITGVDSLIDFSIVTASRPAYDSIKQHLPSVVVTRYQPNTQPDTFNDMLSGKFQVVVDRPEIIQYYYNKVPAYSGKLMPIGERFDQDGVSFGVSRPSLAVQHPIMYLFNRVMSNISAQELYMENLRSLWFGPEPSLADQDASKIRKKLKDSAENNALMTIGTALLALAVVWVVLAILTVLMRYPRFLARNECCAVVREAVGLRQGDKIPASSYTMGYHTLKSRVITGLARLVMSGIITRSNKSPEGIEATLMGDAPSRSLQNLKNAPQEASFAGSTTSRQRPKFRTAGSLFNISIELIEASEMEVQASSLLDYLAGVMARKFKDRPRSHALWGVNMVRDGRAKLQTIFHASHRRMQAHIEHWVEPTDQMELSLDDAADVILDIVSQEEWGLLKEGGLVFPYRSSGTFDDKEINFDNLQREADALRLLLARAHVAVEDLVRFQAEEAERNLSWGGAILEELPEMEGDAEDAEQEDPPAAAAAAGVMRQRSVNGNGNGNGGVKKE